MPLADVNGAQLYYEVAGDGPALVMLHGHLLDSGQWDDQFLALSPNHRVIRYDARGFGRSTMPPQPFAHHEDLLELLTSLGIERAALMGCSGGGSTVIDFTLAFPERTLALVLVGTVLSGFRDDRTLSPTEIEWGKAIRERDVDRSVELGLRLWTDGARLPEQVEPRARERMREMMTRQFSRPEVEAEARRLQPPAVSRLGEIQVPTLVAVGDQDVRPIHDIADLITQQVAGARKVVIADAGHHPNMEHPEQFNELLASFLGQ
jgi:pimeloyl-ACP methyl ester carboxylesterase